MFNGNRLDQVVAGRTTIQPRTWNHAVMVRKAGRVTVWLNGASKPEIDADLPASIDANETSIYFGGRNDNFSNLNGYLDEAVLFDRALTSDEARGLFAAAGVKAPTSAVAESKPELESMPRSPTAGLKSIHVPEGYVVELVAAEPLVLDPVAIDWGADVGGRDGGLPKWHGRQGQAGRAHPSLEGFERRWEIRRVDAVR